MNTAISNIAWSANEDELVYDLMRTYGFKGLEIAPGRILSEPYARSLDEHRAYAESVRAKGFDIIGMQALLFGTKDLHLFKDEYSRQMLLEHLTTVLGIARAFDIEAVVFGSPKNRAIGDMPKAEALVVMRAFFRTLGDRAAEHDVIVCIEPNDRAYGTDFATTAAETIEIVKTIDHPHIRAHCDVGAIVMSGDDLGATIRALAPYSVYTHISEPFLAPITEKHAARYSVVRDALRDVTYNGWVSIEMKRAEEDPLDAIEEALKTVRAIFADTI